MKYIDTQIWSNVNGFHWMVDTTSYRLSSAKTIKNRDAAEQDLKRVAKRLGIKLGKIRHEE